MVANAAARGATSAGSGRWTQSALPNRGGRHAGSWAALPAAGRAVEVVAVGRNPERPAAAGRVPDGRVSRTTAADGRFEAVTEEVAERPRRDEEIASIRTAIATLDGPVLAVCGDLNGAAARCDALETAAQAITRVKPMIASGRRWMSRKTLKTLKMSPLPALRTGRTCRSLVNRAAAAHSTYGVEAR